ncbi:hypothetical protein K438DRAFT_1870825 [Mycena galopus ATCC 62051]|nr:hypothetical protein K438DRAFT_1870825 [Mycena galopus ATCC 62051]
MVGLRSVIWVSFRLLLCCYPRLHRSPAIPTWTIRSSTRSTHAYALSPRVGSSSFLCSSIHPSTPRPPRDRPPSTCRPRPRSPSFLLPPLPPLWSPARPSPLPSLTHPQ